MSGSRLPALTPMRIGRPRSRASRATVLMWSALRMLPGLRGRAWTPASLGARGLDAGFDGGEGELVLEVDVSDDRHRGAGHDLGQPFGGFFLVAGAAHDVTAGTGHGADLREGPPD